MRAPATMGITLLIFSSLSVLLLSAAMAEELTEKRTEERAGELPPFAGHELHLASQARYEGLKNSYEKIERIMGDGTTPQKWQIVTGHSDHLGRVRWETQEGTFDDQQARIPTKRSGYVYDGTLSCRYDFNFSPKEGPQKGTDTHAVISEGTPFNISWPRGQWITEGDVAFDLLSYEKSRGALKFHLEPVPGEDHVRQLTLPEYHSHRIVSLLDDNAGGLEKSRKTYNQQGDLTYSVTRTFQQDPATGLWVANLLEIVNKPAPTETPPLRIIPSHTTQRVLELKINAPDFDENIFSITLEPGTYVHDGLRDVHYLVGDQQVLQADLARQAKQALAAQKADPLAQPYNALLAKELQAEEAKTGPSGTGQSGTGPPETAMSSARSEQSGQTLRTIIAINALAFATLLLLYRLTRR